MNHKKILLLGGAYAQIPIIREARNRGMYIITCDYLPNNPGHKLANEYYNVSTTDFKGVLDLARVVKPDYIAAYASDPAAPTAAYVSEKLGLPGNTYLSVRSLAEKDLFRNLLKDNGFNTPKFVNLIEKDDPKTKLKDLLFPYIIKPTDSSGSKGITRIDCEKQVDEAFVYALAYSRKKQVIAEEFIDNDQADIHGDGFVIDNELVFSCMGDHIYNIKTNPYNPIGTLWPTKLADRDLEIIKNDVSKIVKLSGFSNGPINIEARINSIGKHFIMEIGPRSGGHFVPQAIKYATGFDMVKAFLDVLNGNKISFVANARTPVAYYAIHSDSPGMLKSIKISDKIKPFIKEFHQYVQSGERVSSFQGANATIGILLMTFDEREKMEYIIDNIQEFIDIKFSKS
jgi:biotin carboxylase